MNPTRVVTQAYLSLAVICLVWGTTYTAIKFAIRDFPPFMLVGVRQTAGGLLLLVWAFLARGKKVPGMRYILLQSLIGFSTITGGNGLITWGMQYVSSGLSAVIGALTPVMVVLINLGWRGAERVNRQTILGVMVGFAGLGIVFSDGWADFLNPAYRWGIAACFGSCFTWSLGTVMAKQFNASEVSPLVNAGLQITAGGLGGFAISLATESGQQAHPNAHSWLAVVYLALIGSALAFTLYTFALKHLSATVSSMYTYINPVVAVMLGFFLLDEPLTGPAILGMSLAILGVWLVNSAYKWGPIRRKNAAV